MSHKHADAETRVPAPKRALSLARTHEAPDVAMGDTGQGSTGWLPSACLLFEENLTPRLGFLGLRLYTHEQNFFQVSLAVVIAKFPGPNF